MPKNFSSLLQWQFASLVSRFIAVAAGIVQGIFVVRLLSAADYGLVGIIGSVASVIGVYQHLGLASGSTREISATKTRDEAFKVFVSSLLVRLSISFPLAFGLWFLAPHIATNIYSHSAIILPLRIQAVVLLLQGIQDILGASLSGSQRFKPVLIYQAVIALLSVVVYVLLISHSGFLGYYWALLVVSFVGVFGLGVPVVVYFAEHLVMPKWGEIKDIVKAVLSIGIAIYAVKIIYTFWQRLGPLFLGTRLSAENVGVFNFALFYATKLLTVSEAFASINLPVMTKKFVENVEKFKRDFLDNYYKIYSFILLAAVSAIFWVPEILHIVVGHKYDSAIVLIPPLVFAFTAYSLLNLLGSSIIVPAKLLKELVSYYLVLIVGTVLGFFVFIFLKMNLLLAMSLAAFFGSGAALALLLYYVYQRLDFLVMDKTIVKLSAAILPLSALFYFVSNPLLKSFVYVLFLVLYMRILALNNIFTLKKLFTYLKKVK